MVYLLFYWTLIPALVAFIEPFLISGQIERHNTLKAQEIISKIKLIRQRDR